MTRTKKSAMLHLPTIRFCANMAELVDATDLKSVGNFSRAGSIPAFRTILKNIPFWGVFLYEKSGSVIGMGFHADSVASICTADTHRTVPNLK